MSSAGWVRALAPAKVNLWLDVLLRGDDGYHQVDTGMVALDLCDALEARASPEPGVRLEVFGRCASSDVPPDARNLASRAAAAYLEKVGSARGIELRLEKRVPSRSGLGAGSADAAAALLACERACGQALDDDAACDLLTALGADCVFFRRAASTGFGVCTGRGEQVEAPPSPASGWTLAVLVPDVGASTAEVYRALARPLSRPRVPSRVRGDLFELSVEAGRGLLSNDLERAALEAVPGLAPWRALLDAEGAAHFQMSGSGTGFFGLYRDPEEADRCLTTLAERARARGLAPRGAWLARPAGSGARRAPS